MTPTEWKALPPLVSRGDVLRVGIPEAALPDLVHEVQSPDDTVPFRKIAALRGLRGQKARRKGPGQLLYIKASVSVLLPKEYR